MSLSRKVVEVGWLRGLFSAAGSTPLRLWNKLFAGAVFDFVGFLVGIEVGLCSLCCRMADFWQGEIPTIHRLGAGRAQALAAGLGHGSGARRVTLVLPCHVRDLRSVAFQEMLRALAEMTWLERIVLGLDGATEEDETLARAGFAGFWQETQVLRWAVPAPGEVCGKGRNVQRCFDWVLAQGDAEVIALHDCDIAPYDPEALLRLVTPVARPEYGYRFAKGYYARFSDRLHGRLTRLLFQPLVSALAEMWPDEPRWRQLAGWRYPLAGEMAMEASVARRLEFHPRWGLETGVLGQIPELLAPAEFCQVDLCERYDHKHQPLTAPSERPCLAEAATDIASTLLAGCRRRLEPTVLCASYDRHALIAQARAARVAWLNGLIYEEADELAAVAEFRARLQECAGLCEDDVEGQFPAGASVCAGGSELHSWSGQP